MDEFLDKRKRESFLTLPYLGPVKDGGPSYFVFAPDEGIHNTYHYYGFNKFSTLLVQNIVLRRLAMLDVKHKTQRSLYVI